MIINNNMKLSSQRVQFLKSIKMIYHPPPPSIQELSNNCPNYRSKPFFLSFFFSRIFFLFLQKKKKHTFRADFTGTTDFTIPDDLYTPLEAWRRRRGKKKGKVED